MDIAITQKSDGSFGLSLTGEAPETGVQRATPATYIDGGVLKYAGVDEARYQDGVLLLEGASTNLLTRSSEFDHADWVKSNVTVTPNAGLAPDGTMTADLIAATGGGVPGDYVQRGDILLAVDASTGATYGHGVAISTDGLVMAVGASNWSGQGGVYIYDLIGGAWVQRGAVLTAADSAAGDQFGTSVSLSGDGSILAVGAAGWDGALTEQGAVYIYDWSGGAWVQRGAVLTAGDAASYNNFGVVSLSSTGATIAVGAHGANSLTGAVYVYDWSGAWVQRGVTLTGTLMYDLFGVSVSLSGDGAMLAVGSNGWDGAAGEDQGGVYIYDWSGGAWVQRGAVLAAGDASPWTYYGSAVALTSSGATLLVGAPDWTDTVSGQGGVYIYDWSGGAWVQRGVVLTAAEPQSFAYFATALALSSDGSILIAGYYGYSGLLPSQGGVYTYDVTGGTGGTGTGSIAETHLLDAGQPYTLSVFSETIDAVLACAIDDDTTAAPIYAGAYVSVELIRPGLYRHSISFTVPAAPVGQHSVTVSPFATAGSCYLWGAQLEPGALSSYIPTADAAAARAADVTYVKPELPHDLQTDDTLRTAVIISLFTDRRAAADDVLPDGSNDRRGWWVDPTLGSRLWLLSREKQTPRTLERAREYAEEALAWLVEDGIARAVTVEAAWVRRGVLGMTIAIDRAAGGRFEEMFIRTLEAA